MILRILIMAAVLLTAAEPANAAPLFTALGSIFGAIKGSVLLQALLRIGASVVLSKLAARMAPKPQPSGIKSDTTAAGSQNPCAFILGDYATGGVFVAPPMTHGEYNGIPKAYLTYVVELGDIPGQQLLQVIINGEVAPLGGAPHADYGTPVSSGKYAGKAWVRYYNGTQTAADPMLLAKYGGYPERPWSSQMVGRGICYAILTFRFDREAYSNFPQVRFVMRGIALYDPRKDSTAGGSGAHRWANPATWEPTQNPIVMAYNIHRGITVAGHVWGGGSPAEDLPLSHWITAMNVCDALVDNGAGGTEPQFRAGYEVMVNQEPAAVLEDLMNACLGEVADAGGSWLVMAGDTPLPSFLLTDDDLVVSQGGEAVPFPTPQETFNAITANYPEPAALWETQAAAPIYNAAWEAEDGGRRRAASVDFPAVPFAAQVQRLMRAMIAQDRRFLTHSEVLPPEAMVFDVLDVGAWTSAREGYDGKLFEISRMSEDLETGIISVALRERDPDDTAIPGGYFVPPQVISGAPASAPVRQLVTTADIPDDAITAPKVADGAINAAHIDAGSFNVAGLAVFGGTLESANYVPLTSGWRITETGDAELNSLIVRADNIQNGAVSQKVTNSQSSVTVSSAGTGSLHLTTSIGAVPQGKVIYVSWSGQARVVSGYYPGLFVERRVKTLQSGFGGGSAVWGDWKTIWTGPQPTLTTWEGWSEGEFLAGVFEDVGYRFRFDIFGTGVPASSSGMVQAIQFIAQAVIK